MRAPGKLSLVFARRLARLAVACGAILLWSALGYAQPTFTWDAGGSPDNWSVANNWNPNGAPTATTLTNYVFGTGSTGTLTADGTTAWEVNSLTFASGASATTIAAGTGGLKLYAGGITQSDNSNQAVTAAIALQQIAAISGSGGGSLTLSGAISGTGGLTISRGLTLSGTAANTFTGTTTINSGTTQLGKSANVTALSGNIVIGNNTANAELRTNATNQTAATSNIDFTASTFTATLNLNGSSQSVGTLSGSGTNGRIILGGGTLTTDATASTSYSGNITGTGGLIKTGTGTLGLANTTSSYTLQTEVKDGAIEISGLANTNSNSSIGRNATIKLGDSTTTGALIYNSTTTGSYNRKIDLAGTTGGGTLQSIGSGVLTLTGTVTSSGAGAKTFTLSGNNTGTNTLSGVISENSSTNTTSVVKTGTGTWALTGTNTFTGTTTVNQGILSIDDETSLGSNPGAFNAAQLKLDGGILRTTATFAIDDTNRGVTIGSGGGTFEAATGTTLTISNAMVMTGTTNIGTSGNTGKITLGGSAADSGNGAVNVNFGTLEITKSVANGAIGDTAAVTVANGATLNLNNGQAETIGSLAGAGTVDNIHASAVTLTVGGDNSSTGFSGVLTDTAGNLNLTKTGSGTMTLSGANTYQGVTTISDGTLSVGSIGNGGVASGNLGSATNAAANLVFDGGTLKYTGGTASTDRNFTISSGKTATLDVTTGASVLTMSGNSTATNGALNKTGLGTLALTGANLYTGGTTVTAGTLQLGNTAALGAAGASLILAGGTVDLATNASVNAYNTTLTTSSTIISDVSSGSGIKHTLGTLGMGAHTLTVNSGSNVSADTNYGLTFGATALSGAAAFNVANNGLGVGTLTLGSISESGGAQSITKLGAGALTLAGANTYTGGTTLSAGTLNINTTSALGTGGLIIGAGTTINNSGAGAVALSANNAQTWNGSFTFTGTKDLSFGSGAVTLGASATVTVAAGNLTVGAIGDGSSSYNLTKAGGGTLVIAGASSYDGLTTVSAGTLKFGADNAVPTAGSVSVGGSGTLDLASYNAAIASLAGSGLVDLTGGSVNKTLTITETGSAVFSGIIQNSGTLSTLALVKAGGGSLTLSGANTYSGGTTLSNGTLNLNSASALGSGGAFTISAGNIDNTSGSAITLSNHGQNWNGSFVFSGTQDLNLGTGAVTLNASPTVTVTANTLTVGGAISGAQGLTKAGAGTLALTATNSSYSGATTINGGNLTVAALADGGANSSIGAASNAASNLVLNGGTLKYTGAGNSTDRLFTVGTNGGTIDAAGSGTLGFTNTGSIGLSGSGARTLTLTGANNGSLAAAFADNGGASALTKTGAGTWTLAGANAQTGTTTLSAGTLTVNSGAQLSGATAALVVNGGTLNLNNTAQTVSSLTGSAGTVNLDPAHTLTVNNTGADTFSGVFGSSGTLTKAGTGSLTLAGSSVGYTGAVNVSAGTLIAQRNSALGIGFAGTTVSSGATLKLDANGGSRTISNGTLNLAGVGDGGAGALVGSNGNNRWSGNLALTGNTTITNTGSGSLNLGNNNVAYTRASGNNPDVGSPAVGYDSNSLALAGNTLTFAGTGTIYANTRINDAGGLIVAMTNTSDSVWLTANYNTFTGSTKINNGTLVLNSLFNTYPNDPNHPNYFGINGNVTIGDGTGAAGTAVLSIASGSTNDEMINYNRSITLNKDGLYNLLASQSISGVEFNSGKIDLGSTGTLYLNGDVDVKGNALAATITGSGSSSLSLTVHNGNATTTDRIFNVDGDPGTHSDLTISSRITNGSLTKTGDGTLTITSDNTTGYGGTTTVSGGILNIQNDNALGQADGLAATGTTVNSGGTLQMQGTALVTGNERLVLNGTGYTSLGALNNYSGSNTFAGPVIVNDARVQSDSGLLTINNTVTINTALDVRGVADTTISGAIGGAGTLQKNDTGTLILSGTNTYAGATTINNGVVRIQNADALGDTTTSTTVTSNATVAGSLEMSGGLSFVAEPLTLNGAGYGGNGALRSYSGANTFQGNVTLGSASLITAKDSNSLIMTGTLATAGNTLTIGSAASNNGDVTARADITGSGDLNKAGSGTFTFARNTAGTTTGTVGATNIAGGTLAVGTGVVGQVTNLTTGELTSATSTTLLIASGSSVNSVFDNHQISAFNGVIDSTSAGSLTLTSAGSNSGLQFGTSFTANALTLNIGGSTIGGTDLSTYFRLELSGVDIKVGTIHITGDTILDFNNSINTFLTSSYLVIDQGVKITVEGWSSTNTAWYATNTTNGVQGSTGNLTLSGGTVYGNAPLNQVTFTNYNGLTTTWVAPGQGNGWLDKEIRPTPEPSTYGAIIVSGALGLLGWRRYRGRKNRLRRVVGE